MYKVIEPIKDLVKVKHFTKSDIYFEINTKFTPILLLFFSVLLTAMDVLRAPIDCYTDHTDGNRKPIMDNYCWSIGTYICKNQTGDVFSCFSYHREEDRVYQRYYQWVSLVFVLQAAILYMPAYFWKLAEGGLMHKICDKLDSTFNREKWTEKKSQFMDYFNSQYVRRLHTKYVRHFIVFKVFSCAFIALNILMLKLIIPEFWSRYTQAIFALLTGDSISWMQNCEMIFPKAGKCSYKSYGPSGSLQLFDALCLLPLNVLNQKLFIIVWVWYIIQLIIAILNLLYWIIVSYSQNVRIYILSQKAMQSVSRKLILHASRKADLGHFFVLNQIAKNTNPVTFVELISDLALNATNPDQNANKSA